MEKVFELNVLLLRRKKLYWGGKQTDCLPCAGAAAGAGQNEFCSENRHPSDDIEPATLENESLGEERTDNFEPACELACESDLGDNRQTNKHTRARILFFNTTRVNIRLRNSLSSAFFF